ncbi:MAG: hypothetical protein J6A82_03490 [Coprococcus sp.]|nr:hypothetical protein [Coprococcus sp.]
MLLNTVFIRLGEKFKTGSFIWKFLQRMRIIIKKDGIKNIRIVKKNSSLINIYKGKRCFVVGNGPSLNDVDFSLLENEYVFTVNMLMDHPDFYKLKSNYHVIADAAIFNGDPTVGLEDNYLLNKFKKLKECQDLILFAPLEAKKAIEDIQLDKELDIKYFAMALGSKKITDIDITSVLPSFNKVVHYAIGIALNLGFDEIYLLGCEETSILTCINLKLDGSTNNDHCYSDSNVVKDSWRKQVETKGMAWEYRQEAKVLDNYREIFDYCRLKNVKICNLTKRSLIDSIPQINIEDVLQE